MDIKNLKQKLSGHVANALNRTLTRSRKKQVETIQASYPFKKKELNRLVKMKRARREELNGRLRMLKTPLSPNRLNPRPKGRGVVIKSTRGNIALDAFLVNNPRHGGKVIATRNPKPQHGFIPREGKLVRKKGKTDKVFFLRSKPLPQIIAPKRKKLDVFAKETFEAELAKE